MIVFSSQRPQTGFWARAIVLILFVLPISSEAQVFGQIANGTPKGLGIASRSSGKKLETDIILDWNQVMLDANAQDTRLATQDQPGPVKTARAFAIVSVAMFDAWNSIHRRYSPYLIQANGFQSANEKAAVSKAAMDTLSALYPQQSATFAAAYSQVLDSIPANPPRRRGIELGTLVAAAILAERSNDGSELNVPYTFGTSPGDHQPDPLHPNQGVYAPHWYHVDPFVIDDIHTYLGSPPPPLTSPEYTLAYQEVLAYGGNGTTTPTIRNAEQTTIGIFWGYDGAKGLGTPPRLYNQIARAISLGRRNSADENARLFALINLAMADAGIQCWYTKYYYNFWRPVIGIQQGNTDGNPATIGDPLWLPLGAPATNGTGDGIDFTPPFPAYSSGHATFGAAAFYTIANFYGTTRIPFEFVSDEFNGLNRGSDGNIRPLISRTYGTLDDAVWENGVSRIYLGVHWSFDATMGIASGHRIANKVSSSVLLPKRGKAKD